jgi:hypothetical protein
MSLSGFSLSRKHLGDDQIGHLIVDRTDQENHALLEQTRVNVVRAFTAAALLNYHRHEAECLGVQCRITVHTCLVPCKKGLDKELLG